MFPLLRLPLLALQNVADLWNPFEIYYFSKISKRTRNLARLLSHAPASTQITYGSPGCFLRLKYPSKIKLHGNIPYFESYDFRVDQKDSYLENTILGKWQNKRWVRVHENPQKAILEWAQDVMEIFKCSLNQLVIFNPEKSKNDFLKLLFSWLKTLKQSTIQFVLLSVDYLHLKYFFEEFPKSIKRLRMKIFSVPYLINPPQISSKLQVDTVIWNDALIKEVVYALDFKNLEVDHHYVKASEIHDFLMSWKGGKTNQKMVNCVFKCMTYNLDDDLLYAMSKIHDEEDPGKMKAVQVTLKENGRNLTITVKRLDC